MKLLSFLFLLPALAQAQFLEIRPDQSSYTVGSKAVLLGFLSHLPEIEGQELYFRLKVGGETVRATRLSDQVIAAFPARFSTPGELSVETRVYLQEIAPQQALEEAILGYQKNARLLEKKMARETDPELKEILQQEIHALELRISQAEALQEKNRSLIEISTAYLTVLPAPQPLPPSPLLEPFSLSADHSPADYLVGQRATFLATLHTTFTGPDGPQEAVFRGSWNGNNLPAQVVDSTHSSFLTPLFTAGDTGSQNVSASLFLRSQKQSDLLRDGNRLGRLQKLKLERAKAGAVRQGEKDYWEAKIQEIQRAITAFSAQLEEILLPVSSTSLPFTVN